MENKKKYIKIGLIWNSLNVISHYGFQFIAIIVLARLLSPGDYGLLGILMVFISVADVFVDSGFGGAIIRKINAKQIDYVTMNTYNIVVALMFYIVYYLISPEVADFYGNQELCGLMRLYALVIPIYSLNVLPSALLQKQLRFKVASVITMFANMSSLSIAMILAYKGFGVYSLIWQYLSEGIITCVLYYAVTRYQIKFGFSIKSFKDQFSFGVNTTLANLLRSFCDNIYSNVIAKSFSVTLAGFYNQAYRISSIPNSLVKSIVGTTFFPIFSQEKDPEEFKVKLSALNEKTNLIIITFVGAIIPVSYEVIYFLLGEKWLPAAWSLKILLIGSIFLGLAATARNVLKCKSETFLLLKIEGLSVVVALIFLAISYYINYEAIVISYAISALVLSILYNIVTCKKLSISLYFWFKQTFFYCLLVIISYMVCSQIEIENLLLRALLKLLTYSVIVGSIYFIKYKSFIKQKRIFK